MTFVVLLAVIVPASCGSAVYVHTLWEAGNARCGGEMAEYGGWGIGFNGETDAFVCSVHDAQVRVVAQKEVPIENVLGRLGRVPFVPALIAHELESVDGDHWEKLERPGSAR
jgi:hypothetical protein